MIKAKITFEVNMFDIISLLSKLEHSEQKQIMFMLVYIKSKTFFHGRKYVYSSVVQQLCIRKEVHYIKCKKEKKFLDRF